VTPITSRPPSGEPGRAPADDIPQLSPPELRRTLHRGASTVHGYAAGMPAFPGAARPEREPRRRTRLIHVASVAAVLFTIAYLAWRAAFTIDLGYWWVAIPLLVLEVHNALGLAMFTVALWDVDAGPRSEPREAAELTVAVLIATYDEPAEVLLPTIAAAVALEPAHETWVLDDGRRPEIRRLAEDLGASYLTRPTNEHAKAGNINHALEHVDADIVAILDADHIAQLGLLRNTLGYFDDPGVALVQTPQDFYNLDSFEHQVRGGARMFSEQAVFYRVIAAAKNRWGAAFWCGTSALVRTAALRSVGGVATGTVTEDIQTTVRMHKRGWKTVYHNEVLARGMAARTASEYLLQRQRWAAGAMQVLRRERVLTGRGLTLGQRIGYATTLWGWFDAWRSLGYIALPIAVIATGGVPITAPLAVFGPMFLATLGIQFVALRLLARGHYPPVLSIMFEFLRMPAVLVGTLTLVGYGGRQFRVTPKGAISSSRSRAPVPRLMIALLVGSALAAVWFGLTVAGMTPFAYRVPAVAEGAFLFLGANAAMLAGAAMRIRAPEFAPERRNGVRLPVMLRGTVAGVACAIDDLSLGGTGVTAAASPAGLGEEVEFVVLLPDHTVTLASTVRRALPTADGGVEIGLEFDPGQTVDIADLALALLATDVASLEHRLETDLAEAA
jgi:cellulose synthase/poly-beta-1,6-N-acetylglucosamine synthase-like glycosyltransferase